MLELIPLAMTLVAVAGYGTGLHRLRRRGVRWPVTRATAMLAGSLCAAAAVLPPIASHDELFPVHVGQHLLLGMAAPAFLALSAPVTLALRALPRRPRRILLRLLHGFPVAVLAVPATAVVLNLGGLYALYLTGLAQGQLLASAVRPDVGNGDPPERRPSALKGRVNGLLAESDRN